MLENLNLRSRILLGYGIPVILSIVSSGIVYSRVTMVQQQTTLTHKSYEVLDKAQKLALSVQIMDRAVRGHLLDRSSISLETYEQARTTYQALAEEISGLISDSQQQAMFQEIQQAHRQIAELNDTLVDLVNDGRGEAAIARWKASDGRRRSEEISRLLENFEKREQSIIEQRTTNNQEALQTLVLSVFVATLSSAMLAVIIGLRIASGISQRMNQAASAVSSSSSEIAATIEQQERTATQQATSVHETTTTMDELGASSRQITEQAEAAVLEARQALTLSEAGTVAVDRTMEGMEVLREKVSAIADQILRLSEQTSQIGNISGLVSDLANQTNMLALNAAVEAVRAGEHGKGFAVVAAEIRKLADQSRKSAEKINTLVVDIQSAINSTVMVTDEGTKTVETGVKVAQETAQSFNGVKDSLGHVMLNNQQISLSVKQQAIAIQQVIEAMNALNAAAQESAGGISQVRIGTQRLNAAALNLQAVI